MKQNYAFRCGLRHLATTPTAKSGVKVIIGILFHNVQYFACNVNLVRRVGGLIKISFFYSITYKSILSHVLRKNNVISIGYGQFARQKMQLDK
jgi:hypothetical protein